jgi:maltose alpha-D-glucosyltransferase/alpha-amylase
LEQERGFVQPRRQHSAEPNAAFSTAPPDKRVRPVISEGDYRYERVNVAKQRLEFNSLLFGRTVESPTPGEPPEIVDLDGHDYRWMRLR